MMVMCSPTGDIFIPPEHNNDNDNSDYNGGDVTVDIEIDITTFDENDAVYNFDLKLAKEESKDHEKCNSGKGGQ